MVKKVVHKNYILLIVAIAQFMVVLDTSIVNVALPSIYKSLQYTSASSLQWIVTAYTLAFGGFLLLGGRAADLFGRKRMFLAAVTMFTILSFLCGVAQNPTMLNATRALQGLTAAFMSPAALSIILTTFKEGKERAKALSVWGAVAASGAAVGVLLGGILTQYLDWRWNFFVNVPVGIAVFFMAWHYVPESKADLDHNQLDLPGAVSVTVGLMSLVYAITQAPSKGWTGSETLLFFGLAIVLLAFFIWNEARSKHALMPLRIFKVGNVAPANVAQLPMVAAMFAMFFFISLYVQQILGYSPVKTGLSFLPVPFVIGIVATNMAKIVGKIGYKIPIVTGALFVSAGLFYMSHITVDGSYWTHVFPGLVITALGMGQIFISVTIAATSGVPHHESGLASGLLNTSQQIGGALGLAILSGIATSTALSYAAAHASDASSIHASAMAAQVHGYHNALLVGALFPLITATVAARFIKVYDIKESDVPAAL
ncbi:MFS transporter [Candidatus Saccharibacteria bacterium]|nr:MFS transporter [Candidatus Saccharibacteria bacterium]